MNARLFLALRRPATLELDGPEARVEVWSTTLVFPAVSPPLREALRRLAAGASAGELSRAVTRGNRGDALVEWYHVLGVIERHAGVVYELRERGRPLARAVATTPGFCPGTGVASSTFRWTLSRFAYLHRDGSTLVLESASAGTKVELLHPSLISILSPLSAPVFPDEALSAATVPRRVGTRILGLLEYCGLLTRVDPHGTLAEDDDIDPDVWSLPDLLLHRRSRSAWNDLADDARASSACGSPRTLEEGPRKDAIDLGVPSLDRIVERDASFTSILENRRSIRKYGTRPITKERVGEFLYRSARTKEAAATRGDGGRQSMAKRPYPSAGASHELEVYVCVARCEGLSAGLYHYDSLNHRLEPRGGEAGEAQKLIEHAATGAPLASPPQVLIILAARFDRLMAKYGPGSYALVLKDAGVLLQTMYLVATAMELAPCAVGSGDSERFARVAETNPYEETSVGELLLGSRRQ